MDAAQRTADLLAFCTQATRYVTRRGWQRADVEDLVSCMVLEILEHPTRPWCLAYLYRHAVDRLSPRHGRAHVRDATLRDTDDRKKSTVILTPDFPDGLLQRTVIHVCEGQPQGARLLRLVARHFWADEDRQDVARREGLTPARVSQLLRGLCVTLREELAA
jgi:hypothetical protein